MKRSIVTLLLVACLFSVGCGPLKDSPYRQALPDSASDIQEYRSEGVEFTYLLRARITEGEFRGFVDELGLVPVNNAAWGSVGVVKPSKPHGVDPDWWSPIRSVDRAFQLYKDTNIISAKYENGFVYLSVVHL